MSEHATSTGESQSRPLGQRLKRGVESKVLVPLAATVLSAATSYLLRKLPVILEEKVLPKLREQGGAEALRDTVVEKAAAVGERASEVLPGHGDSSADDVPVGTQPSNDERAEERRRREERRRERKRALQGS